MPYRDRRNSNSEYSRFREQRPSNDQRAFNHERSRSRERENYEAQKVQAEAGRPEARGAEASRPYGPETGEAQASYQSQGARPRASDDWEDEMKAVDHLELFDERHLNDRGHAQYPSLNDLSSPLDSHKLFSDGYLNRFGRRRYHDFERFVAGEGPKPEPITNRI